MEIEVDLGKIVHNFAAAMRLVDAHNPQAVNIRTKKPYSPGIGPHTERATIRLIASEWIEQGWLESSRLQLEVPYPVSSRSKCDFCVGDDPNWEWVVEVKMLRFMGDNGKPNDNILMHILSPYPHHRSAVTDCQKLLDSQMLGRKGLIIYGYDYDDWPMDPAIEAFELLAGKFVSLGNREVASMDGLIHPVHQRGRVFGWELSEREVC